MRDAEVCYHIGKWIVKLHNLFDVSLSVSIAQLASRIFKHKFLERTIPPPPKQVTYAALHSYHGGKNNMPGSPGWYRGVNCIDISSAYPFAMSLFPSFSVPEAWKILKGTSPSSVPDLGVYKITGRVKSCKWPVIFDHGFNSLTGDISEVWVTGWEINEALRAGELELTEIKGYFYKKELDPFPSPFKSYVEHFYKKKSSERDKILRHFYKILLNALYGKFIQTKKRRHWSIYNIDTDKIESVMELEAGGMFYPFIATLITGHTRAYIHRMEHEFQAIHTSTDGVITYSIPEEIPGLGGYCIEAKGKLLLFRPKLYILYGRGRKRIKYALHGFHGNVEQLEDCFLNKNYQYSFTRPNKLKESIIQGKIANNFETREARLNV